MLFLAWHIAALMRTPPEKPMPRLETLVTNMRNARSKPSKAQQKSLFLQAADRFGLTVKRVPRKR